MRLGRYGRTVVSNPAINSNLMAVGKIRCPKSESYLHSRYFEGIWRRIARTIYYPDSRLCLIWKWKWLNWWENASLTLIGVVLPTRDKSSASFLEYEYIISRHAWISLSVACGIISGKYVTLLIISYSSKSKNYARFTTVTSQTCRQILAHKLNFKTRNSLRHNTWLWYV